MHRSQITERWQLALAIAFSSVLLIGPISAQDTLEEKLDERISLEKGIAENTSLKKALDFLGDRYELDFRIDVAAFKRLKNANIEMSPVYLPKCLGLRLGLAMELLLKQVDATFVVKKNYVAIVPTQGVNKVTKTSSQSWNDLTKSVREKLDRPVTLEKAIDKKRH